MKDNKVERLKKRLTGDAIYCIIIAVVMGVFAIAELSMYFSCNGEFANMLNGSVQGLVMSITFVIISLIIFEIMKHGKPFSKRQVLIPLLLPFLRLCTDRTASFSLPGFPEPLLCSPSPAGALPLALSESQSPQL